uniref:Uncharacterized protein n=1 Tax=Magallana gigas TaxID=29159 RepID=K1RBY7_MAGGI
MSLSFAISISNHHVCPRERGRGLTSHKTIGRRKCHTYSAIPARALTRTNTMWINTLGLSEPPEMKCLESGCFSAIYVKHLGHQQGPRLHLVLSPVVALAQEHSPEVGLGR